MILEGAITVEFALAALPYLLFLACPLMMVACMVGMRKAGCRPSSAGADDPSAQPREARIAALEGQFTKIQTELQALRVTEGTRAAPEIGVGADRPHTDRQPEGDHAARRPA